MTTDPVQSLLDAVRRRLWRGQLAVAARLAMWGSAGLLLVAVAVHLVARAVPVDAALSLLAALWAAMLVRAASRRPSDSACALWADRHLAGASAYTTLLDQVPGRPSGASAPAVRQLQAWANTRVPDSLRLLAERGEQARLSRPLLSMLICTALAALVWTMPLPPLPAPPPSSRDDSPSPPDRVERTGPVADAAATAERVGEVASALRSTQSPAETRRREGGAAPATGSGKTDDGSAVSPTAAGATPARARVAVDESSGGAPAAAGAAPAAAQAAGTGAGSDAGDNRDDRADVGVSRALRGTMTVPRSEASARRSSDERRADLDRSAGYDDEDPTRVAAAAQAGPAAPAATPPAAAESTRLSPTETGYVQAWMKASARQR